MGGRLVKVGVVPEAPSTFVLPPPKLRASVCFAQVGPNLSGRLRLCDEDADLRVSPG